jgi:hypothetical protein
MMHKIRSVLSIVFLLVISCHCYAGGKILASPGVSQIEGSGGGGIVPWAQLAGYATEDEIAASGFCSRVNVDDFSLNACGLQVNFHDRLEVSYGEQSFYVNPLDTHLKQSIVGAKLRLYGDVVYSNFPQISLGIQAKKLDTPAIAFVLGAEKEHGTDVYLAMSKLHLGVVNGYNWLWNITARKTDANQMGLLGFGGHDSSSSIQLEASSAILFNRHLAVGVEFRQKPDNLHIGEGHWRDVFVAWIPNKHISTTLAYVDLGNIAGINNQTGWYLSMMGYF